MRLRGDAPWQLLWSWPYDVRLTVLDDGRVAVGMTYWSSELCDAPAEFRLIDPATGEGGP